MMRPSIGFPPLAGGCTANRLGTVGSVGSEGTGGAKASQSVGRVVNLVEYLRLTRSAVLSSRGLSLGRGLPGNPPPGRAAGCDLFEEMSVALLADAGALMRVGALI
jgi:hypothetical protein